MDLLLTLVVGGVVGWLASLVMGADARLGLLPYVLIGVIGSVLGHWMAGLLGIDVSSPPARLAAGFVGAAALVAVLRSVGTETPSPIRRRY